MQLTYNRLRIANLAAFGLSIGLIAAFSPTERLIATIGTALFVFGCFEIFLGEFAAFRERRLHRSAAPEVQICHSFETTQNREREF